MKSWTLARFTGISHVRAVASSGLVNCISWYITSTDRAPLDTNPVKLKLCSSPSASLLYLLLREDVELRPGHVMKTAIALLAVLAVAAVSVSVRGQETSEIWVSNQSASKSIRASTTYDFDGNSQFTNRLITPGTAQHDEYSWSNCHGAGVSNPVNVFLWLDGSSAPQQEIQVGCDQSIVGEDNTAANGVDIYDSVYNQINTPTGGVLVTLT